jgi:choline dehydrogenase-like flavoprotein
MLIENLEAFPENSRFDADVVIVGGGKAGLTLAREFIGTSTRLLILESGMDYESIPHMELNRVESLEEPRGERSIAFRKSYHQDNMATFDAERQAYGIRSRMLGGCPYWGGKSAPLTDIDFVQRDWVPYSGWPINAADLSPYYDRAAALLNTGPNIFGEELWSLIGKKVKRPPIDDSILCSHFWGFARSRLKHTEIMNIANEFRASNSSNIRTLVNATVTHIDANDSGRKFAGVEISTLAGVRSYVTGKKCVLAAGGIENARLLLISNRQHRNGLGNSNDLVGRFLMDHPGTKIGHFEARDVKAASYLGFVTLPYRGSYTMYSHGLALSPSIQKKEGLLNAAVYVLPEIAIDDPIEAVKRIVRFKSTNYALDTFALAKSSSLLMKGIALKIFYNRRFPGRLQKAIVDWAMAINPEFVVREFQSKGVPHKLDRMALHVMTEQQPNPESRIVLSSRKDQLDMPVARAYWKISEADRRTVVRVGRIIADELPQAGLPAPVMEDWVIDGHGEGAPLVDMAHMVGTTRMSDNPRSGVVDSQCQLHDVKGVYIAGGSVFPTSGHVNPTFTIAALAMRLADTLKKAL